MTSQRAPKRKPESPLKRSFSDTDSVIQLQRLDHLVLTVADIKTTCEFYTTVLGADVIQFGDHRYALRIGDSPQKINLHTLDNPLQPAAKNPQAGTADLCFITALPLDNVVQHFHNLKVPITAGPVERTGTLGPILSVYIRDPDGNLIEVANAL